MKKRILVILLLKCITAISYADDFSKAKAAYDNGQFTKSINLYSKACKNRDGKLCTQLGWLYDNGLGIERDPLKSVDLYTKGCNYGDGLACGFIGGMYSQGRVVGNSDDMKALGFFKKGCALNNSISCIAMTNIQAKHGIYNKKDLAKAYSVFGFNNNYDEERKNKINSCDNGNIKDCAVVGVLYINGQNGFPKDFNKGVSFLSKACDSNEPIVAANSCLVISQAYLKLQKDTKKSQLFINKAMRKFTSDCEAGNAKSCLLIANSYKDGQILDGKVLVKQDALKSNSFYSKACDLGDTKGCDNIATGNDNNSQNNNKLRDIEILNPDFSDEAEFNKTLESNNALWKKLENSMLPPEEHEKF
jgi:TPR repeat protein